MHRIDEDDAAGLFTEGNPSVGQPATKVTDDWLNDVQENICDVVEGSGGTLVKGTYTQLRTAINTMIAALKSTANTWTQLQSFSAGISVPVAPSLSALTLGAGFTSGDVLASVDSFARYYVNAQKQVCLTGIVRATSNNVFAWGAAGCIPVGSRPNYSRIFATPVFDNSAGTWQAGYTIIGFNGSVNTKYVGGVNLDTDDYVPLDSIRWQAEQ